MSEETTGLQTYTPDGPHGPSPQLRAFVAKLRATHFDIDLASLRKVDDNSVELCAVHRTDGDLGGVPVLTIEPHGGPAQLEILYFHGGGYISGSPPVVYLPMIAALATAANARVHTVDYRLAPEARFPAAFDDCLNAYRSLVCDAPSDSSPIAVLGDSAGGNLALAVAVAARDADLRLPSSIAVISPFADLTLSGLSMEQRKDMDPYVTREMLDFMAATYIGESGRRDDPRCSSVFSDLGGLPPVLIQVGDNEIVYDDAIRIRDNATRAGVEVTFEAWRYGFHIWPVYVSAGLPESTAAIDHVAAFLQAHI